MEIDSFRLIDYIPNEISKYYRLKGSFTTPPCTEAVDFLIADAPYLSINANQLKQLKRLASNIDDNYVILNKKKKFYRVFNKFKTKICFLIYSFNSIKTLINSRPLQNANERRIRASFRDSFREINHLCSRKSIY
jgi:hypothetical protein